MNAEEFKAKFGMTIQERSAVIIAEGVMKSAELQKLFQEDARGLMVFMAAMEALRIQYPGIFKMVDRTQAVRMIGHWVAAGEPREELESFWGAMATMEEWEASSNAK